MGCPSGEVCKLGVFSIGCVPDCRVPDQGCAPASFCEADSGICFPGCRVGSDCQDAGALCADSVCLGCFIDAGCARGELCDQAFECKPNCVDAGSACAPNSICNQGSGLCVPGCNGNGDCGGDTPFCETALSPHVCAQCLTPADCPAGLQGCTASPYCKTCLKTCGSCQGDSDCPGSLTCVDGCSCFAAGACAGFPTVPACVGLGSGETGSTYGLCGCNTSDDCASGFLCDKRLGETRAGSLGVLGPSIGGGVCVASCVGQTAGYCASQFSYAPVCNPATGFCVPCLQDDDCTAGASEPLLTPSCVLYPDGLPTPYYLAFVTGGGQCGCRATADCDDGRVCKDPSDAGECVPPCTYVDGIDTCPNLGGSNQSYCNTFTGFCQQCLDDYDCTGMKDPVTYGFPASICTAAGNCAECSDASQCPADRPGCAFGACGYCDTTADCPAGGGFVCRKLNSYEFVPQCLLACESGDDAGLGTVSDGGPACPAALPLCVVIPGDGGSWCGECRGFASNDCPNSFNCCGSFCAGVNDECPFD